MDEVTVGVKPCKEQCALDLGIKDAIAVVQCGIERIGSALSLSPRPVQIGKQELSHASPIAFGSPSFGCQQLQPNVVAGVPSQRLSGLEGITNFGDDAL